MDQPTQPADYPQTPDYPQAPDYRVILKQVAFALVILGCIEIAATVVMITTRTSNKLSINLLSFVAAAFLYYGNLRAASVVRWYSVALLAMGGVGAVLLPLVVPVDLLVTALRVKPQLVIFLLMYTVLYANVLLYFVKALGQDAVHSARSDVGKPRRDMRIPAASGCLAALGIVCLMSYLQNGSYGKRAKVLAAEQVGSGFQFLATHVQVKYRNSQSSVIVDLMAWNSQTLRNIQVQW